MICVVGGGVLGCTLTYLLAREGGRVTLLEGRKIGQGGASSVPVALLNPYRGRSARASAYDLTALAAMWRLVDELEAQGLDTGVRRSGVLRVASNRRQAKVWRTREGVRWFEPDEVPAGYHAPFGGFVTETGGWLEPRRWLRALVAAARARGAAVLEGCAVERLEPGWALHTSASTLRADRVVLCTGAAPAPHQAAPVLERVAGEVIGLQHAAGLPYPLAGAVYGAQFGATFYLGGNHRPAAQPDERAPAQLQRAGGWFVPTLREAPLRSVWHGVRAKTEDNLPLVRELEPGLWFAGALAGRGFLAAAQVAREVATQLGIDAMV